MVPKKILEKIQGKEVMKKLKMKILNWIQGWSGQLNSWAWTEWGRLHREDWGRKIDEKNKKDS